MGWILKYFTRCVQIVQKIYGNSWSNAVRYNVNTTLDDINIMLVIVHSLLQIDPDERPLFEEAVKILEQTTVPEEEEEERLGNGGREADDLRACFSEPLLRY